MRISIIAAIGPNKEIGYQGQIPWHYPKDLKHFKKLTTDHTVIMGRITRESIGRDLPNRTNITVSSKLEHPHSLEEALSRIPPTETEVFIIGGAKLYAQALLGFADRLYLTHVPYTGLADTFFPEYNQTQWQLTDKQESPPLIFETYDRIS